MTTFIDSVTLFAAAGKGGAVGVAHKLAAETRVVSADVGHGDEFDGFNRGGRRCGSEGGGRRRAAGLADG